MRVGIQTAVFAVLVSVAIVYFASPSRAAESCRNWVAEMLEDEGGPVLTAHACSDDTSQTWLSMTCHEGKIWLQHDLGVGGDKEPASNETAEVEFVTDTGTETVSMQFQEMNAMFGGEVPADGELVKLLKANQSLLVRDSAGVYPARTYSLKGSSAALTTLVADCR
jgi:hypothetical protein